MKNIYNLSLVCATMSTFTIITIYTHITNDIDHFNNTSFSNQNMIHWQTSENLSSKQKMKNNNTKPCAKTLV